MLKSKWGVWIVSFVILFSCGICGIIGATFKESPDVQSASTVEPVAEPTVEPVVEPTVEPTVKPVVEPTVEPCTNVLLAWKSNMQMVVSQLWSSTNSLANKDFQSSYESYLIAHALYNSMFVPSCNADAVQVHQMIGDALNELSLMYNANDGNVASFHFNNATTLYKNAAPILTKVVEEINNK